MAYDNIKSHKKPGFHPLFRRRSFQKTAGGGGGGGGGGGAAQIDPRAFLGLRKY